MPTLVNLTPHTINVVTSEDTFSFPPSGTVARVSSNQQFIGLWGNDIPLYRSTFGDVIDLPDPQDNTIFVVSALVRSAAPDRFDLASPGDLVRDDAGNVVGCKGLIIND